MVLKNDVLNETEVYWNATKRFKRRVPLAQIRYLKLNWKRLKFKGNAFGYGFIVIPITNMIYFFTEKKVKNRLDRKLVYATTIQGVVTGNF